MDPVNILLLVEDSDDDIIITQRKIFRSTLKVNEFVVAKNLTEARVIVCQKTVDIILLDLNLPESRGIDTLLAVRGFYTGVIVVVTSIDDELVGVEAIRKGADDYIVKNTMTEDLLSKSIIFARERRNMKNKLAVIADKFSTLEQISGE